MLIISQLARAYDAVRNHIECSTAARQLHAMSDHELRDIGISRDQIDRVVFGHADDVREGSQKATEARPVFKRPAFGYAQLS